MGSGPETDSTIFSIKIRVVNVARQEINIIMRYTEFLSEKILNLHTVDEKMKYAEPVWDMLLRSYQKIGGFKSAVSVEDLANEPGYWKILRRGDRITAVVVYKKIAKTHNFKLIASATETILDPDSGKYKATLQGLRDYNLIKTSDIKMKRSWAEVSGPAERVMIKSGAQILDNKYAAFLTGKEILKLNDDGYHYTRLIQGEPHEKVIVGFVNLTPEGRDELVKKGFSINELPDNIKIN